MTSHPSARRSLKELFINHWKVAGELDWPKNMTIGSNNPLWVMNTSFHWSLSLIQTLLYPHHIYIKLGEDIGIFEFVN